jgi:hypothetical protein
MRAAAEAATAPRSRQGGKREGAGRKRSESRAADGGGDKGDDDGDDDDDDGDDGDDGDDDGDEGERLRRRKRQRRAPRVFAEAGAGAGGDGKEEEVGARSLAGLVVCVTGGLSNKMTRDAFVNWLRKRKAGFASSVREKGGGPPRCDVLLVAGGKAAAGDGHLYALKGERKLDDARAAIAAGAPLRILDEAAFAKDYGFPPGRR